MDMERLLAELGHLDENALEVLREGIAQRETELRAQQHPRTAEEWGVLLDHFVNDFWDDTPPEEQRRILEAIRLKNTPQDQDE